WAQAAPDREFTYDGSNLVAESEAGRTVRAYAYGPGGMLAVTDFTWPAQVLDALGKRLPPTSVVTRPVVTDSQGSVVAILTDAGAVAATYQYDPFGKLLSADEAGGIPQTDVL